VTARVDVSEALQARGLSRFNAVAKVVVVDELGRLCLREATAVSFDFQLAFHTAELIQCPRA
jgi:hypothetical protein